MTKAISIFSCANELHKIAIKQWRIDESVHVFDLRASNSAPPLSLSKHKVSLRRPQRAARRSRPSSTPGFKPRAMRVFPPSFFSRDRIFLCRAPARVLSCKSHRVLAAQAPAHGEVDTLKPFG